jgi:hypothetical protein
MHRHKSYVPHGVIPAVLLPFDADLAIDEASFRKHLGDVAATSHQACQRGSQGVRPFGSDTSSQPCSKVSDPEGLTPSLSERSEFGARLRARRQFAPAIRERTRSFFPTTAPRLSV